MMRAVLLAAVASMGLVACVGSLEPGPGDFQGPGTNPNPNPTPTGGSQAQKMFEDNVYPIIAQGAGGSLGQCIGCHSSAGPSGNTTGFVSPDVASAYATITSFQSVVGNFAPSAAPLILKITTTSHNGRSYTADQLQKITDWLNQEVTERGPTNPPPSTESPSQATDRLLNQWSGCMTLTNFNSANMANSWGNMTASNNQQCRDCHVTGYEGFIATTDAQYFFDTITQDKFYMLQYFTVDLSQGTTAAKVIINQTSFMGVSQGQDPHREHPRFDALNNQGMTALSTFYDSTMAAVTAGGCGPSKLMN